MTSSMAISCRTRRSSFQKPQRRSFISHTVAKTKRPVPVPAQAVVMPGVAGSLGGGLISVLTVQTELPALTLFIPLLLLAAIAYGITGGFGVRGMRPQAGTSSARSPKATPPLFAIPGTGALERLREGFRLIVRLKFGRHRFLRRPPKGCLQITARVGE